MLRAFLDRRGSLVPLQGAVAALAVSTAHAQPAAFKHIIIIVQENRTPDNIFGSNPNFEPGVDIVNGKASTGSPVTVGPYPLDGCYDIPHTNAEFQLALTGFGNEKLPKETRANGTACPTPANPAAPFTYVDNTGNAVTPYFDIALNYGFSNRMFQTNQGPSFPAHQFLFGGTSAPKPTSSLFAAENMSNDQTGNKTNAGCVAAKTTTVALIDGSANEKTNLPIYPCLEHPTLADVLDAAPTPITWRYYAPTAGSIWTAPNAIRHICQPDKNLVCQGPAYTDPNPNVIVKGPIPPGGTNPAPGSVVVLSDIQNCTLRGVSWVIPDALMSDHAGITTLMGPQWVAKVIDTLGEQPTCPNGENYWKDTAIIVTWDDWGGFYDHVPPFALNKQPASPAMWGDGYTYGFRVPMLVVSAYTPPGYVNNVTHDFGSILYFIEHNFGLGFIGGTSTDPYGQYADYHAMQRGDMGGFFSLSKPRAFVPIANTYIGNTPRSTVGPDND